VAILNRLDSSRSSATFFDHVAELEWFRKTRRSFASLVLPITNHQSLLTMWLLWALLSALFAGLTAVFAKIGVVTINSNLATAIRTSIIVVITWGIALATSRTADLLRLPMRSWLFLSLSAIATGLSWLCYFRALQIGEVAKVAPIDKLSVVVAIVISVLFLGERLSVRESLGVCLIVCGALCLAWK
jgi:bacterial/archaeal transporter family protein